MDVDSVVSIPSRIAGGHSSFIVYAAPVFQRPDKIVGCDLCFAGRIRYCGVVPQHFSIRWSWI